jgi:FixJ family two-component response regulator
LSDRKPDVESETIYIVDDDPSVVTALSRLTRTAGFRVEAYSSAREFLEHHRTDAPGCAILDVAIGDSSGLEIHRQLAGKGSSRPVIFISGQSDLHTGVQAMKAGAVDFLTKPVSADDLFRAIETAMERDHTTRQAAEEAQSIKKRLATLSPREHQVFLHVITGRLNKQIAADLGIVEKTAKVHRGRMMAKMGARNVATLVHMAERLNYSALTLEGNVQKPVEDGGIPN